MTVFGHIIIKNICLGNVKVAVLVFGSPAAYYSFVASLLRTKAKLTTVIGKDMAFYRIKSDMMSYCLNVHDKYFQLDKNTCQKRCIWF